MWYDLYYYWPVKLFLSIFVFLLVLKYIINEFGQVIIARQIGNPCFYTYIRVGNIMQGMQKINEDFYVDKSKVLGKGNFGVVFKGYHLSENRIIAVKFIDKKMLDKNPDYERQIVVMEDLAKIRHPNIMGYYGYDKNNDGLYCFIQFCNSGSLKQLVTRRISQMKVLTLFRQLLDAMVYINSLNKVHRDLKPDNILLDQHEQLKIADFGLARDVQVMMTKGACTPLYAAPQVINLDQYDSKCDVWSAGLILYEMLTGKEMFQTVKTKMQLLQQMSKFGTGDRKIVYSSSLHPKWQKLTSMMLTYDKKKRPTFKEMLKQFQSCQSQMEADLVKKYGYETPDYDDGLRITKTVSPYQSIPMKNGKIDMVKKLKEQRSFTNLNNLRKYLTFYRTKSEFLNRLIKEFTTNLYGALKNVYKYLLMFLATSAYICRLQQNLKQIKNKKISTPDGPLSESDFEAIHQHQLTTLLNDYAAKNQLSIAKFKGVITKQINGKILGNYMTRQQQKGIILATQNILQLIGQANKGQYTSQDQYMSFYGRIIQKKDVYVQHSVLQTYPDADLKTYLFIRLIGHMDDVFPNINYVSDDYLRMKKQEIQNTGKPDMLSFIKPINIGPK